MRHILIKVILTMLATLALAGASALDADAQTRQRKKQTQSRQQKTNTVKTPPKSQGETRSIDEIRRKKSAAEQKISETAGQLDRTGRELNRQLNRLNSLNADITNSQIVVDSLRTRLASIGSEINLTADSIHRYEEHLDDMRRAYIDAMRRLQPYGERTSALAFIFSSSSFTDAYRRIRYVRQFAAWRQAKADAITAAIDEIALRRSRLTSLRHEQDVAYRKAEASQRTLASQQAESEKMVKDLRKNEAQLRKNLDLHRRQAAALDNELGRLIQAEQDRMARQQREEEKRTASQPKPANNTSKPSAPEKPGASPTNIASNSQASISALTGSFASNKGRLPFPVEGTYKIVRRFGRQPHPT
ncbi:MAG: hypothetical protein K2K55_06530, partial [Duncaniella sp.]|nr:hypothetical protein [Duncaniella sp.]